MGDNALAERLAALPNPHMDLMVVGEWVTDGAIAVRGSLPIARDIGVKASRAIGGWARRKGKLAEPTGRTRDAVSFVRDKVEVRQEACFGCRCGRCTGREEVSEVVGSETIETFPALVEFAAEDYRFALDAKYVPFLSGLTVDYVPSEGIARGRNAGGQVCVMVMRVRFAEWDTTREEEVRRG